MVKESLEEAVTVQVMFHHLKPFDIEENGTVSFSKPQLYTYSRLAFLPIGLVCQLPLGWSKPKQLLHWLWRQGLRTYGTSKRGLFLVTDYLKGTSLQDPW